MLNGLLSPTHPESFDVYNAQCPSRRVLNHVTGRWGVLVLGALEPGTLRFNELRRRVSGVSDKMLAQTLKSLQKDGFVLRRDHSTVPPHVDYTLTSKGEELAALVGQLVTWVEGNMADVD